MLRARLSARDLYCSYALCTCSASVWILEGSKPVSSNCSRSSDVKAVPLFRYGVDRRALPLEVVSQKLLVIGKGSIL